MTDVSLSAPLAPSARLGEDGRYELLDLLGAGGMASVWSAHDKRLDRTVAVKIMADTLALDPAFVARFEREARLVAGLSHPHVVQVFDFGTYGGRPFLVMDHIGGGTLADRIAVAGGNWNPAALAHELLDALGYVHAAGVLHRDLKPANVLVGVDGRARLTDFGIAQIAENPGLTGTGLVIGTPKYLPPEVERGEAPTARSDLYSLGALLRECAPDSPALAPLIDALTQPDPAHRPASAAAALALLSRRAPERPVATVPTPVRDPNSRPDGAPRPRVGRALLLVSAIAAVAIAALALLGSRGDAPALDDPPTGGSVADRLDVLDRMIDRADQP
ncbi:MAG: serine/threonine-protein kinase [Sporichthyaceae bacterium]